MADVAPNPNEMDTQTSPRPNDMEAEAENEHKNVAESAPEPEEPEEVGTETLYVQNLNDRVKLPCKLLFSYLWTYLLHYPTFLIPFTRMAISARPESNFDQSVSPLWKSRRCSCPP